MTDKPKRRFELTLTAGADDLASLRSTIEMILSEFTDDGYHSVSGGYATNFIVALDVDYDQDHDNYHRQLKAYLEAKKETVS